MKKIIIIGSSGAGKTTLAHTLSSTLNIPSTELDSIYHQANWQPLDKDEFIDRVDKLSSGSEWIICGNYYSRLGSQFWSRADTIIWCDYPFHQVFIRLLRRTFNRWVHKEVLWNGNRESLYATLLTKDSVIAWMLRSWRKQKKRYAAIFDDPSDFPGVTFVRLRSSSETKKYVESVNI